MYQFKIVKEYKGGYKFELAGIKLLVDGYSIRNGQHLLETPAKAIAYFNIDDTIYGVSNEQENLESAEAFFDAIKKQYLLFTNQAGSKK